AHEDLARLREPDHGRRGAAAFGVGNDDRLTGLQDAHDRVGGAEVDSDGLGHCICLRVLCCPGGSHQGIPVFCSYLTVISIAILSRYLSTFSRIGLCTRKAFCTKNPPLAPK